MTDIQWGLETYEGEIFIMGEGICRDMAEDNEDYTLVVNRGDGWVEVEP